jgi:hypothetical protein
VDLAESPCRQGQYAVVVAVPRERGDRVVVGLPGAGLHLDNQTLRGRPRCLIAKRGRGAEGETLERLTAPSGGPAAKHLGCKR